MLAGLLPFSPASPVAYAASSTAIAPAHLTPRHYDAAMEIAHLQRMIAQKLKKLGESCRILERRERELQVFLDEYTAQTGQFYVRINQIRGQVTTLQQEMRSSRKAGRRAVSQTAVVMMTALVPATLPEMPHDPVQGEIAQECAAIYQTLRALYSPAEGEAPSRYQAAILELVETAYARGSLWGLREMEHRLVEHAMADGSSPEDTLARLRGRFEKMTFSLIRVEERIRAIEASAAYRLKLEVDHDPLRMEMEIHLAAQRLEQARALLLRQKLAHKAQGLS